MDVNIGYFLFSMGKTILGLGTRLYELLNKSIDISWINKILDFFNITIQDMPNSLSLIWILTGGGVTILLLFIIGKIIF